MRSPLRRKIKFQIRACILKWRTVVPWKRFHYFLVGGDGFAWDPILRTVNIKPGRRVNIMQNKSLDLHYFMHAAAINLPFSFSSNGGLCKLNVTEKMAVAYHSRAIRCGEQSRVWQPSIGEKLHSPLLKYQATSDAFHWNPISLPRIHQIDQTLNVKLSFYLFFLYRLSFSYHYYAYHGEIYLKKYSTNAKISSEISASYAWKETFSNHFRPNH